MVDFLMDYIVAPVGVLLLAISVISLLVALVAFVFCLITGKDLDPKCSVYSEPKTKHGFIWVGKTYVPTTYTARDCLIWEAK